MNSFKQLDAIADIIIKHNLPKEHIVFLNHFERRQTDKFLKSLGSSAVSSLKYKDTSMICDSFIYGRITFYLVDIAYMDDVSIHHDWVESKTMVLDNKAILSRYCNDCGKTETYHGGNQKWVETGYIKTCEPDQPA